MNMSKMDGTFVSRSRSRSQIRNNNFYLEQEPYLGENASFTLTHIAVLIELYLDFCLKQQTLSKINEMPKKNVMTCDT